MRELQRRLDAKDSTKGITANCFNPGLIVGTGFFRDQNPIFTKVRLFMWEDGGDAGLYEHRIAHSPQLSLLAL
jgi:hypothetical protein